MVWSLREVGVLEQGQKNNVVPVLFSPLQRLMTLLLHLSKGRPIASSRRRSTMSANLYQCLVPLKDTASSRAYITLWIHHPRSLLLRIISMKSLIEFRQSSVGPSLQQSFGHCIGYARKCTERGRSYFIGTSRGYWKACSMEVVQLLDRKYQRLGAGGRTI